MGNQALDINRPVALIDLTTAGSDFLWMVFAVMLASGLGLSLWTTSLPSGHRTFHYLGIAILFTASVAYFSMASDLGATAIPVEFVRQKGDLYTGADPDPTRSIWYARCESAPLFLAGYIAHDGNIDIDWVITTRI